ncbi:MAG: sigma-70 family RNA polymerase sigma factor [Planctomycetota bacterium]
MVRSDAEPVLGCDRVLVHQAIAEHHAMVYRLAFRVLRQQADAEDVCQDVFLKLASQVQGLRDPNALPGWLRRVAFNLSINCQRAKRARRKHETAVGHDPRTRVRCESPGQEDRMEDPHQRVAAALDTLPDTLRWPFVLHYQEGLKYHEIAQLLDCPPGTVARRISVAKERLRARLVAPSGGSAFAIALSDQALARADAIAVPTELSTRLHRSVDAHFASTVTPGLQARLGVTHSTRRAVLWLGIAAVTVTGIVFWPRPAREPSTAPIATSAASRATRDARDSQLPVAPTTSAEHAPAALANADRTLTTAAAPAPPTPTRAATTYRVHGTVRNGEGEPIAGATVRLWLEQRATRVPRSTQTDAAGRFEILGTSATDSASPTPATPRKGFSRTSMEAADTSAETAPQQVMGAPIFAGDAAKAPREARPRAVASERRFTLECRAAEYQPYSSDSFELAENETKVLDVTLLRGLCIDGVVFDARRCGIEAAELRLLAHAGEALAEDEIQQVVRSDGAGAFHFGGLKPGCYVVESRAAGQRVETRVASAGEADVVIESSAAGKLEVNVFDAAGARAPDVELRVCETGGRVIAYAMTDAVGAAEIEHLPAGRSTLFALESTFPSARVAIEIRAGVKSEITVQLASLRHFAGRLTGAASDALTFEQHVVVMTRLDTELAGMQRELTVDSHGAFACDEATTGKYRLAVLHGATPWQRKLIGVHELELSDDFSGEHGIPLDLAAPYPVEILVESENGAALEDAAFATLFLEPGALQVAGGMSTPAGLLRFALPNGRYRLVIGAPQHIRATHWFEPTALAEGRMTVSLARSPDDQPGTATLDRAGDSPLLARIDTPIDLVTTIEWLGLALGLEPEFDRAALSRLVGAYEVRLAPQPAESALRNVLRRFQLECELTGRVLKIWRDESN